MSIALDSLIFITGWVYVLLAPYTKVEESFNLHAIHDVLSYGVGPKGLLNYDHIIFPGAVPRTFIGSVLLAWLSTPFILLRSRLDQDLEKSDIQMIIRFVLASCNAFGLCLIRRAVSRRFGRTSSISFTFLSVSQFHLPFWMGRTLPNMFALLPVNVALSFLIDRKPATSNTSSKSIATAIALLTFSTVVFRAELALLLGPIALQALSFGHISFRRLIMVGLISGLSSIAFTIAIDSYFWGKPFLWPEFAGIYFNVYEGKSAEWGTSPRHAYWTSHLPKLLLSSLPLSAVGFLQDQRLRTLLLPFLLFVGLISCLGHKEWRFIIYVVPIFNIVAAGGARYLITLSKRSAAGKLFALSLMPFFIGLNLALTFILALTSMNNYPGGNALALLHQLYPQHQYPSAHVHISNLAAQTGASLFLQLNAPPYIYTQPHPHVFASSPSSSWVYNKTEHLTLANLTAQPSITHLIVETQPHADEEMQQNWEVAAAVEGFERWNIDRDLLKTLARERIGWERLAAVVKMVNREELWILHRKSLS